MLGQRVVSPISPVSHNIILQIVRFLLIFKLMSHWIQSVRIFKNSCICSDNSTKRKLERLQKILTIFILITQDDARKLLVTSIASNIYENLKQNGDVKDILSLVFEKNKRDNMLQNLADTMVLRGILKSNNIQYKMVGQRDDGMIILLSDGQMFILIDWE